MVGGSFPATPNRAHVTVNYMKMNAQDENTFHTISWTLCETNMLEKQASILKTLCHTVDCIAVHTYCTCAIVHVPSKINTVYLSIIRSTAQPKDCTVRDDMQISYQAARSRGTGIKTCAFRFKILKLKCKTNAYTYSCLVVVSILSMTEQGAKNEKPSCLLRWNLSCLRKIRGVCWLRVLPRFGLNTKSCGWGVLTRGRDLVGEFTSVELSRYKSTPVTGCILDPLTHIFTNNLGLHTVKIVATLFLTCYSSSAAL